MSNFQFVKENVSHLFRHCLIPSTELAHLSPANFLPLKHDSTWSKVTFCKVQSEWISQKKVLIFRCSMFVWATVDHSVGSCAEGTCVFTGQSHTTGLVSLEVFCDIQIGWILSWLVVVVWCCVRDVSLANLRPPAEHCSNTTAYPSMVVDLVNPLMTTVHPSSDSCRMLCHVTKLKKGDLSLSRCCYDTTACDVAYVSASLSSHFPLSQWDVQPYIKVPCRGS